MGQGGVLGRLGEGSMEIVHFNERMYRYEGHGLFCGVVMQRR